MIRISLLAIMVMMYHLSNAQNLDATLNDYYIQCDKILAVDCPTLTQKGLEELKESLAVGNCGEIENKHNIDFWFEDGYAEHVVNEKIRPILEKYDKLNQQFINVHTEMYEKLSEPKPANSQDKFFYQRLTIKTIKSYIDDKDGPLRKIFDEYRITYQENLKLGYARCNELKIIADNTLQELEKQAKLISDNQEMGKWLIEYTNCLPIMNEEDAAKAVNYGNKIMENGPTYCSML